MQIIELIGKVVDAVLLTALVLWLICSLGITAGIL